MRINICTIKRTFIWDYAIYIIYMLLACHQLIIYGYPYGHDWIFELVRISEYADAFHSGQIIPFWANNLYYGFGAPVFIFYAPLYSAVSSLFLSLGISITVAAIITLIIFTIISAFGMKKLMQEIIGNKIDSVSQASVRIATLSYVLAPYILGDMLLRNASAEYIALCVAPYPLWGLVRIYKNKINGYFILSIGITFIVIAHNLTALIMVSLLSLMSLLLYMPERRYPELKITFAALFTGIGLTTWFWLPALGLKSYISVSELQQGKLDFHNNFKHIYELFGYDTFYSVGLYPLVVLIIGICLLKNNNKEYWRLQVLLVITSLIFLYLQTSASLYLWEYLPFMSLFQFPWRMMGPFMLVIALLIGVLFKQYAKNTRGLEIIVAVLIIINAWPQFSRFQAIPKNVMQYLPQMTSSKGIRQLGLPVTVGDEYLPLNANKENINKMDITDTVYSVDKPAEINVTKAEGPDIHLSIELQQDSTLNIARWYFPGWHAKVNEKKYPLDRNEIGTLKMDLQKGKYEIHIWIGQTIWRILGLIISGIFLFIFFYIYIRDSRFIKHSY